jgi:mitosis inhibitor protein kinase SWE1
MQLRAASLPSISVTTPHATRSQASTIDTQHAQSSPNIGALQPHSAPKPAPLHSYLTPNRRTALHFRSVKNNRNLQSSRLLAHSRTSPKSPTRSPTSPKRCVNNSPKRCNPPKSPQSPIRRPLTRASDFGNSTLVSAHTSLGARGQGKENPNTPTPVRTLRSLAKSSRHSLHLDVSGSSLTFKTIPEHPDTTTPNSTSPSGPLKRSDAMNVDPVTEGSRVAKRRTSFRINNGPNLDVFGQPSSTPQSMATGEAADEHYELAGSTTPRAPVPTNLFPTPSGPVGRKSASLRRSTLQQRQIERTSWGRRSGVQQLARSSGDNVSTPVKQNRPRLSVDQFVPLASRESPFINPPPLRNPRMLALEKKPAHPLSNATLTSSTRDGSTAVHDFSRSLPIGAMRVAHGALAGGPGVMATPKFDPGTLYQKAFLSTGLVSKVNRNPELDLENKRQAVPDTPCKKPTILFNTFPPSQGSSTPKQQPSAVFADFGSPATTTNKRLSLFKGSRSTRRLFDSEEADDAWLFNTGRQDSAPPTPTKPSSCSLFDTPTITRTTDVSSPSNPQESTRKSTGHLSTATSSSVASVPAPADSRPHHETSIFSSELLKCGRPNSPHTSFFDARAARGLYYQPSPLRTSSTEPYGSVCNRARPLGLYTNSMTPTPASRLHTSQSSPHTPSTNHLMPMLGVRDPPSTADTRTSPSLLVPSSVPTAAPVTPTARDFLKPNLSTPGNARSDIEMDSSLVSRFTKVEPLGKGQFSTVYKVTARRGGNKIFPCRQSPDKSSSLFLSSPERVYAVKKTREQYRSNTERSARFSEVRILQTLQHASHVIRYVDSWEDKGHLYIQTEFCEEGNLGSFLEEVGRTGRLDDFRIWKVLHEIALGLKAIHDGGFVHLDVKPANVLVTFEGVLKIADFGLAQAWPIPAGADIEGDRVYLAPETLEAVSTVSSAVDIYSLGLMLVEIACNINLPQNGDSWQALRRDGFEEVPTLTLLSATEPHYDSLGVAVQPRLSDLASDFGEQQKSTENNGPATPTHTDSVLRRSDLAQPPGFMSDAHHPGSLDHLYKWMLARDPTKRPTAQQILETEGIAWIHARRQSPATVYEGNFGPGHDSSFAISMSSSNISDINRAIGDDDTEMGGI